MAARLSALWLALLVLLSAWHEGVHWVEHALHQESCPHEADAHHHHHGHGHGHDHESDHQHDDHAPVGSDGGPLFADPSHAGHAHVCFVCSTPPSLPIWAGPATGDDWAVDAEFMPPGAERAWSWIRDSLPPRRGPPATC